MRRSRLLLLGIGLAFVGYLVISLYVTSDKWLPWIPGVATKPKPTPDPVVEGRPLQEWVKDLSDPNPDVRRLAAETLGNNGKAFPRADKVAPALGKLLHDPDVNVRAAAVAAFGKVHLWTQGELTTLLELAQGDDAEVRVIALEALVPFIDTEERIEQHFRLALQEKNPDARDLMFDLLVKAAPQSAHAPALITEALRSEDEDIRLRALIACCRISPDPRGILGTICEILRQPNVQLRRKAAEAASRVCVGAAEAHLARKRAEAFRAAGGPGDEQADQADKENAWLAELPDSGKIRAALIAALKDPDAEVRSHVAETFSLLGSAALDAKPILADMLGDSSAEVRASAATALGSLGSKARDTEGRMLGLLKDTNPLVRLRAIGALRKIGTEPKELLRPFLVALRDPDERVRSDASIALGELLANAGKLSDDEYKEVFFALLTKTQKTMEGLVREDQTGDEITLQEWTLENLDSISVEVAEIVLPELVNQLKESSNDSRRVATRALQQLLSRLRYSHRVTRDENAFLDSDSGRRTRTAIQAIVPVLTKDLSSSRISVRMTAAEALASIGPEARPAILELCKKLESKDKKEIMEALESLLWFDRQAADAVPALIKLFRSKDRELQVEAAMALRNVGQSARAAVPALLEAIRDPSTDAGLGEQAAAALVQIDVSAAHRVHKEEINNGAHRYLERVFNPQIP